jgi:hypothetical protein
MVCDPNEPSVSQRTEKNPPRDATAGQARFKWVRTLRASAADMANTPDLPTEHWWNEVRSINNYVCYELLVDRFMPYGDLDIKVAKMVTDGLPDALERFMDPAVMRQANIDLCSVLYPAMLDFARAAPWCSESTADPILYLFAAPGKGVISIHYLFRRVQHFTSFADVKNHVVLPLDAAIRAAATEWVARFVAQAQEMGVTLSIDKVFESLQGDPSVYQTKGVRKWRTPFATKERECRPFYYFEPEDGGALLHCTDFPVEATLHREIHVTTVGVYTEENQSFAPPPVSTIKNEMVRQKPAVAPAQSSQSSTVVTELGESVSQPAPTSTLPRYDYLEWIIDAMPPLCSETRTEWYANTAAVATEAKASSQPAAFEPLALKLAQHCSPGRYDEPHTRKIFRNLLTGTCSGKPRTVASLIQMARKHARERQTLATFTVKLKELELKMRPPRETTASADRGRAASITVALAKEVAMHVYGEDVFTRFKIQTTPAGAVQAENCHKMQFVSTMPAHSPHDCPVCESMHAAVGFSLTLWMSRGLAEVMCLNAFDKTRTVVFRPELGPTAASLCKDAGGVPEEALRWLSKYNIPPPNPKHPWLRRNNPMYISAALFPTLDMDEYDIQDVIAALIPLITNTRNATHQTIQQVMTLPLKEWIRHAWKHRRIYMREAVVQPNRDYWKCKWVEHDLQAFRATVVNVIHLPKDEENPERKPFRIAQWVTMTPSPFTIKRAIFVPRCTDSSGGIFNTFDRFGVMLQDLLDIPLEEAKVRARPYFWHILHRICSDRRDVYEFVLDWLAFILQYGERSEVMLGMISIQGTGKGLFVQKFMDIIGAEMCFHCTDTNRILSRFNFIFMNQLVIYMDECMVHDKRMAANDLKGKITEPTVNIERKFCETSSEINRMNFIFSTNNQNPLHVESSDRRSLLLYPSDELVCGDASPYGKAATDVLFAVSPRDIAKVLYERKLPEGRLSSKLPYTEAKWRETLDSFDPKEKRVFQLYCDHDKRIFPTRGEDGKEILPPMAEKLIDLILADYPHSQRPPRTDIESFLERDLGVRVVRHTHKEEMMMIGKHINGKGTHKPNPMDPNVALRCEGRDDNVDADPEIKRYVFDEEVMAKRWRVLLAAKARDPDFNASDLVADLFKAKHCKRLKVNQPHRAPSRITKSYEAYREAKAQCAPDAPYDQDGYPLPIAEDWDVLRWRADVPMSLLRPGKEIISARLLDDDGVLVPGPSSTPGLTSGADTAKVFKEANVTYGAQVRIADGSGPAKRPRDESDLQSSEATSTSNSGNTSATTESSQQGQETRGVHETCMRSDGDTENPVPFTGGPISTDYPEKKRKQDRDTASVSSASSTSSRNIVNVRDPKYRVALLYLQHVLLPHGIHFMDISNEFSSHVAMLDLKPVLEDINVTEFSETIYADMLDQLSSDCNNTHSPPSKSAISKALGAKLRELGWNYRNTSIRENGQQKRVKIFTKSP